MKDFRQLCPACKQTLELPISASGKRAQCPACEATFIAGEKLSQTTVDPASPVQSTDENASVDSAANETDQETHPEPTKPQNTNEPRESSEPLEIVEPPVRTANTEPSDAANPIPNNPINSRLANPINSGLANPANSGTDNPISSGLANPANQPISASAPDNSAPDNSAPDNSAHLSAAEDSAARKTDTRADLATPLEVNGQYVASAAETANQSPDQLYSEDRNPFSQPLLQKAVVTEPSSFFVNSNEISDEHITAQTQITIMSCSFVEIFKTTWAILLDRGLLLVASLLVLIFILAFILAAGTVATWIMSLLITDAVMFIVYCSAIILISMLTTILLCRNAISVVRKSPQLVADSSVTFRSLLNTLVPASLIAAVASYFKWQLLPMYTIDITVIVLIGLCTIGTLGWFWSSLFLCSDMQCSGFKSLVTAAHIFYRNKVSTLALISTCTILMLMGIVSSGLLLIVVLPFIQLLLATSYLMMTNQPFANPRYLIATDETN